MKKLKVILRCFVTILILIFIGVLILPFSRLYIGYNIKVHMDVKVNNKAVSPINISCVANTSRVEQLKIKQSDNDFVVLCHGRLYSAYHFTYDIEMPDGNKELSFSILKTHDMGPQEEYFYTINLVMDKADGEWYAEVGLKNKKYKGINERIKLTENENAYIKLGP